MAADKIDHLERTLSRAGTSHRVNLILFLKQEPQEGSEENLGESDQVPDHHPAKRKCKHSLATDVIKKEIAEYYRGRRVGPRILSYVQYISDRKPRRSLSALPRFGPAEKTANTSPAACSLLERLLHQDPR